MRYINQISRCASYINPAKIIRAANDKAKKVEAFVLENWRVILIPTTAALCVYSIQQLKKSKVFTFIKNNPAQSSVIFCNFAAPIAFLSLPIAIPLSIHLALQKSSLAPDSLIDMVEQAKNAMFASTWGRESKLTDLITILGVKQKGNPILVGPAGCGKTTLIESLAKKIASGEVPHYLKNAAIFSLNIDALFAGAKFVGESEQRFISFMKSVEKHPNAIVFVDEVHRIMQGRNATQKETNLSEKLKPYMTKGIHFIGATTTEEYSLIAEDQAIKRRFHKVILKPFSRSEVEQIIKQVKKERFEDTYEVEVPEDLLPYCLSKISTTSSNPLDEVLDLIGYCCVHARNTDEKSLSREMIDKISKIGDTVSSVSLDAQLMYA